MSWNEKFFNSFYQEMFMNRDEKKIKSEVDLILFMTDLKANSNIADFCCGIGDILNELNKRNFNVFGVDWSKEYVDSANKKYQGLNVVKGDAITHNFKEKMDLVINWYSSFGYFNDKENIRLLSNMVNHLKQDGTFLLEIYNSYSIIKEFTDMMEYEKIHNGSVVKINRKSKLNLNNRVLKQNWIFENDGKIQTYETENKIYLIDEMISKMESAGLKNVVCYERPECGNLIKKEATLDSKRLVFVGVKK